MCFNQKTTPKCKKKFFLTKKYEQIVNIQKYNFYNIYLL